MASVLFAAVLLSACAAPETKSTTSKLELTPIDFSALPGWDKDAVSEVLPALRRSCAVALKKAPNGDWAPACHELENVLPDNTAARAFFEHYFQPHAVNKGSEGLFTGYYEPELRGSWKAEGPYQTPLFARPDDLITIDLGEFKKDLKGQKIVGRVLEGEFKPYDNRAEIEGGALKDRAKILLWVDDPVDAFFLAIQGSGRVRMTDGSLVQVGYDAGNGRAYVPLGRVLADLGAVPRPVTMPKIREWLIAHPDRMVPVLNLNPSAIFFRINKGDGPLGAQGVALSPERSLAVDPAFVPLGSLIWLDTKDGSDAPLEKLLVAQDTGGAIKGAVRGDVFWGAGAKAETQAGAMQSRGTYYLLLPKPVTTDAIQ